MFKPSVQICSSLARQCGHHIAEAAGFEHIILLAGQQQLNLLTYPRWDVAGASSRPADTAH